MDFASCLILLATMTPSPRARRLDWPDDGTYITIINEKLYIYTAKEKIFHSLTISTGDILGEDWVIKDGRGEVS